KGRAQNQNQNNERLQENNGEDLENEIIAGKEKTQEKEIGEKDYIREQNQRNQKVKETAETNNIQESQGSKIKAEELDKGEDTNSKSSRLKSCQSIQLYVDLNCEVNKPEHRISGDFEDEVEETFGEALDSSKNHIDETESQEEEQDNVVEIHLKEMVDKEGLSPAKRGRSRHRKQGKKQERELLPP
ncbi:hypothetical protein HAX54_024082, partial [Datura stramonium]|nr:hypothetical protein [Datura stramonium]